MYANLRIATRLGVMVGALCGLLVIVGVIGVSGTAAVKESLRATYEESTRAIGELQAVSEYMYRIRARIDAAFYEENVAQSIRELEQIGEYRAAQQKAWSSYRSMPASAEEKALADEVDGALNALAQARAAIVEALSSQGRAGAYEVLKRVQYRDKVVAYRSVMEKLQDLQTRDAKQHYMHAVERFGLVRALSIASILFGLLLGVILAWMTIRSITQPLYDAMQLANRIALGDLSGTIETGRSDETGLLLKSLASMRDSLRKLVSEIQSSVGQLSTASSHIAASAHQVASASDSQSEAASAMAASVEEMTVSIGHISDRAADTQSVSTETGRLSREGASVVRRSADEMEQIAQSVGQSADSMRKLGDKSKQIAHIVNVIKDIADQTNLLALNAAIEAARAGEQGRGFAVVADEVRKLSEKTAGSTAEIAAMVDAIAAGTQAAVRDMEHGVNKVGAGVELARKAGQSINHIEEGSAKLLDGVNDISGALREQSNASNDIAKHVEKIAQMTEANSVAVRQTAQASRELQGLAGSLQQSVGRFKL